MGTAKCYGLNGQGFESQWGLDFPDASSRPRNPSNLLYNGKRVALSGIKRPGVVLTTHPLQEPRLNMGIFLQCVLGMCAGQTVQYLVATSMNCASQKRRRVVTCTVLGPHTSGGRTAQSRTTGS